MGSKKQWPQVAGQWSESVMLSFARSGQVLQMTDTLSLYQQWWLSDLMAVAPEPMRKQESHTHLQENASVGASFVSADLRLCVQNK